MSRRRLCGGRLESVNGSSSPRYSLLSRQFSHTCSPFNHPPQPLQWNGDLHIEQYPASFSSTHPPQTEHSLTGHKSSKQSGIVILLSVNVPQCHLMCAESAHSLRKWLICGGRFESGLRHLNHAIALHAKAARNQSPWDRESICRTLDKRSIH